jgi:hypothetical protein
MDQSPQKANQDISHLLRNPKVHCAVHKSPPLVAVLRQMNTFHILTLYYFNTHLVLSFHLCLGLPNGLSFRLSKIFYVYLSPLPCTVNAESMMQQTCMP